MSNQVDKTGTACTNGGGTTVLESHGTVYGPGGQYVNPFSECNINTSGS